MVDAGDGKNAEKDYSVEKRNYRLRLSARWPLKKDRLPMWEGCLEWQYPCVHLTIRFARDTLIRSLRRFTLNSLMIAILSVRCARGRPA